MSSMAPHNFSWVDQGKVAGLALPRYPAEYQFLLDNGIKHLVSLTERRPPNHDCCPGLTQHHLKITDFTPPSPAQIDKFLSIVKEANAKGEVRDKELPLLSLQTKMLSQTYVTKTTGSKLGFLSITNRSLTHHHIHI